MRTSYRFSQYAKAGMVFAVTTATYFFARATGVLPSWLNSAKLETTDIVVSEPTPIQPVEVMTHSASDDFSFPDLSVTDFEEIDITLPQAELAIEQPDAKEHYRVNTKLASHPGQRHLLQQSLVSVVNPISDQVIEVNQQYVYFLDDVFAGNYSVLSAVETGQHNLPSWLRLQPKLLSTVPTGSGSARGVAISGNTVFVANGYAGLQIINVSNASSPRLLSTFLAGSGLFFARGVVINGSLAFIADYFAGLQIIDVSNASSPRLLSSYSAGNPMGIAISGSTAFVADGNGKLQIIDVSNVNSPRWLSSFPIGWGVNGVTISGSTAFVANDGGLQIIDVSNPNNLRSLASITASSLPSGSDGIANGVAISQSIAFIATNSGLQIMNVSNLSSPRWLSFYPVETGSDRGIAISEGTAFVTDDGGLHILDVSNVNSPRLLSSLSDGLGGSAYGVVISGSIAFLAENTQLQIVDVSRGSLIGVSPISLLGQSLSITVSTRSMSQALISDRFTLTLDQFPRVITSSLSDQSIYPGNSLTLLLKSGLLFVNPGNTYLSLSVVLSQNGQLPTWLSLSMQPILLSIFPAGIGSAQGIAISSTTAFVADSNGGLQIIDVSNPSGPSLLSSFPIGWVVNGIAISGSTVFVANYNNGLQIINVSNPKAPRWLSSYPSGSGYALEVTINGDTAFVANAQGGLQIIDVSNVISPRLLSSVSVGWNVNGVVISGSTAFVGSDSGLQIIDVSNTSTPRLLSYVPGGGGNGVAISGTTIFLVSYTQLQIIDVSSLISPRLLSTFPLQGGNGIAISGSTAFVAEGYAGLRILDISNMSSPRLLSSYPSGLGGFAKEVAISGSMAFVANRISLQILDISQWQLTANPGVADVGNYQLRLTATDALGGSVSTQPFAIRVEGPPQLHGNFSTQYAKVGQPYHFFVPEGFFTDPNFDPIVFSATLSDGQKLPAWLAFNSISAAFAGTPLSQDVGNFSVTISATDNIAGSVNATFQLYVDYLPVLNQPLSGQVAGINILYQWSLPTNTFFDPSGKALTYIAQRSNGQALPAWLHFNATAQQFSGVPSVDEDGQYYDFVAIASDAYQGQAQAPFSLTVEYFPHLNLPLSPQLAIAGNVYTLTVPVNTFLDSQGRALTYRVTQTNGVNLPNWLGFNARTLILAGVPQFTDAGVFLLQLIATDPSGGWGQLNFNLTVTYQPVLNQPISAQVTNVNSPYQWTFSNNTFTDPLGKTLIYSVQQNNGNPLPAWLNFNAVLLQLSGIPNSTATAIGQYNLNITAQNSAGATASTEFLLLVEYFPQIHRAIASQWVQINQGWTLTIPKDTFLDAENQLLVYKARQANGGSLPNWLSFNPQTLVFSGVAHITDKGKLIIQLTAMDTVGGSAQQNFNLTVTQFPVLNYPIPAQVADVDQLYQWTVTPDLFTDPQGQLLTYTAQLTDIGSLPIWLTFNPSEHRLSGRPNSTQTGVYALEVLAVNTDGASTAALFSLVAEYFPRLANLITPQWANINNPFSLILPADTFRDPEGETLTYQARQESGLSLPNWLTFNRQTLGFSGVPQTSDAGTLRIQLTATDTQGGTAQQIFNLTATYFPLPSLSVADQAAGIDLPYRWSTPNRIFTDPLDRILSYEIQSRGGKPLPHWLSFNTSMAILSGKPNSTEAGPYGLELIAKNKDGAQASLSFNLRVEYFPRLNQPITPPLAGIGQPFTFQLPSDSFSDPDDDVLHYQASRVGGGALPNWLSFNRQRVSFSGVPAQTDEGLLPIQLIASDSYGGSAQANFTLSVVELIDTTELLSPPVLRQNRPFIFQVPATTFSNPGNLTLTYQATSKDGSKLPSWLQFNGMNLIFSGTPPSTGLGSVNVIVAAQDSRGVQAAASLNFNIQPNFPPQAHQPISDQRANVGALFSLFMAADTFIDPNGDSLSYSAQQSDGSPLPDWLNFNSNNRGFSGIPGHGDTDVYALRRVGVTVRASDGQAQASTTFYINVGGLSYVALAVNIGSPLLSFLTALYAVYRERYLFLNRWKPGRYQKPQKSAQTGQKFQCTLGVAKEKVHRVQAEIPRRVQGRCQFFQASYQRLPASRRLPSWMEYDPDSNCLRSKGFIPPGSPERLRIRVTDSDGIILEQFELHIRPGVSPEIREMKLEEKNSPSPRSDSDALLPSGSLHPLLSSPAIELEDIMPTPEKIDEVEVEDSQSEVEDEESTHAYSPRFSALRRGTASGTDSKESRMFCA